MRKFFFSLCTLLLVAASVMGQKKSVVNLIRSRSSSGIKRNGKDVIKVYQGTFKQDFSTLSSDSAYFYPQDNAFEAYGHININQGDTLNIYSDKLDYNGNTKIAILTDNVKMVDKDATLTTNHLTYNTATRIGTYTDGGKLVNKDNTLLSKNGYYFAFSRDAYFRFNVSLTTPDALIKTDTMRYNTGSKIAYFYGPTNIYGTKDKDTLYTENGTYNTNTEQALFGKKNLYKQGTKSLKGDSLFYDRLKGYGRAVKHVTFNDNEQKITLRGDLGTYYKADDRAVVTRDPYVIIVIEEKDTTKSDTVKTLKANPAKKLLTHISQLPLPLNNAANKNVPVKNEVAVRVPAISEPAKESATKVDSAIFKSVRSSKEVGVVKGSSRPDRGGNIATKNTNEVKVKGPVKVSLDTTKARIKRDSVYISADSIKTQIFTYKDLKKYYEQQRLSRIRDTSVKAKKVVKEKPSKFLTAVSAGVPVDTTYLHRNYFGPPKPVNIPRRPPVKLDAKKLVQDSLKKRQRADSIKLVTKPEPPDTTRIRVVIAYHHAKLFKSDLQAKADSMFYSYLDSTIRCYDHPMIWTQGSQFSGDTINLQMKNKKLDNMLMFPNAFIVNVEKDDSLHFNQVAGKRMHGYFKDSKLRLMLIDGNAESIYYSRDTSKKEAGKGIISGIERSLSSRMRITFKDNNASNIAFLTKPEQRYGPPDKFKEDDRILKGFIWKPKDRPISKESIIPSYGRKQAAVNKTKVAKMPIKKPGSGKGQQRPGAKSLAPPAGLTGNKALKDTSGVKSEQRSQGSPVAKDTTVKPSPLKINNIRTVKDTLRLPAPKQRGAQKPK